MSDKFILDVAELAGHLHCQPSTVREAARIGRLPGLKFGDDWVFPLGALKESLDLSALGAMLGRKNSTPPAITDITDITAAVTGLRVDARRRPMPNLDAFTPVGGAA